MLQVKVLEDTDEGIIVLRQEDLEKRLAVARQEAETALLGGRWSIADCLRRLNGYRRTDFLNNVLKPKRTELERCGALLHWSKGRGDGYRFRATKMAQWLEDNLDQIDRGGWK
ncbi:MAG: DUF771 domain-containing protein [Lactobacillus sp.]|uniref:DUF771 domain-containing protein n=1 Tax=Lacticaseibacillus suilingensis TaxID=2799577 RepID=A0ABW4BFN6_9LACO|nr:DUF771 domain-containing protein [Lacticaseibacillus suilingensis]MCI1893561.1 DUF771 domain-containing protein [Lactobacillus sp.]MCI1917252.1 DUF771 domain-containing protein [Lactobacillus sp.]MCI1941193.1 DUF771 domain-containing protein [Lactobacillus sp.]MCI1971737.1 DUF771 domain-containing protein [Lactobacillus sp.]MCI2016177.1 DUF771 domain-containing protein [Lactobacillus sp.]